MKFFSPGPVPSEMIQFSHRSPEFRYVYQKTASLLLGLSGYQNVVFAQGSASSAIETVFSSTLKENTSIAVVVNGEFGRRAAKMASYYSKKVEVVDSLAKVKNQEFCFVVQFETSNSYYNSDLFNFKFAGKLIVDAVSAFPYYSTPQADFVITSSSKQLSGLPAMGIIFYNDLPELIERSDYLNLAKYVEYGQKNETPHTALMPQFFSLYDYLSKLNVSFYRRRIYLNATVLTSGLNEYVVNNSKAPVITFNLNAKEYLQKMGYCVYKNETYTKNGIQISCFNYEDEKVYHEINKLLKEFK